MSAARPFASKGYCPVCAKPRASGSGNPAWSCGDGACRQAAHKRKRRLIARFVARHGTAPPRETIAAMGMRAAWKPGEWFSKEWAATAASRSGIHLDEVELDRLLDDLVDEMLDATVTQDGDRRFAFPPPRRRVKGNAAKASPSSRNAPKRGAQAGVQRGVTVTVPRASESAALAPPAPLAAQGQGRQAAAPITPDPAVKMIAPPTIDGGTAFVLEAEASRWCPELRALLTLRDRVGWKSMPKTVTLHNEDGEVFAAIVRRGKHGEVTLEFRDDAQLNLFDRGGFVVLLTKADALWREGLATWMNSWFDLASWLVLGNRCSSPEHAFDLGWRTKKVELCADFTGLRLGHQDVHRFVGGSRKNGAGAINSHGYRANGAMETIESSKRSRDALTVGTHNKTQKLGDDKILPVDSVYAPTWAAHGYDGKSEIRRVEVRAAGTSLHLTERSNADPTGAKATLDLRPPASLLRRSALLLLWRHATTRRFRLALPPKQGSDLRHQPVDPRWVAVQRAGGEARTPRLVVDRSDVRRLSLAALRARAFQRLVRHLARAAGLHTIEDTTAAAITLVMEATADPAFGGLVSASRATRDARDANTVMTGLAFQRSFEAPAHTCTQSGSTCSRF